MFPKNNLTAYIHTTLYFTVSLIMNNSTYTFILFIILYKNIDSVHSTMQCYSKRTLNNA